jgi:uncharacterized protein (UPF0297 family)
MAMPAIVSRAHRRLRIATSPFVVPVPLAMAYNLLYDSNQGRGDCVQQNEPTISFSIHEDKDREMKDLLTRIYNALREKGYNPINQIVGYILSEDPTYITTYNNARSLIRRIDRDDLLHALVQNYLGGTENQ